jgi:hypothetical protein
MKPPQALDDKKRVAMVEYWISVAEALLELNNFSGVMEMMGGLGATSVMRLKRTWASVNKVCGMV